MGGLVELFSDTKEAKQFQISYTNPPIHLIIISILQLLVRETRGGGVYQKLNHHPHHRHPEKKNKDGRGVQDIVNDRFSFHLDLSATCWVNSI